ncbi:MAG: hypothetical protein NVS4B11_01750 [Ktedonobacteraceae bacterium]
MSEMILRTSPSRKQKIELSPEERAQLNAFIDLLIPSDKDFPPPSSLHLIDAFLNHLSPSKTDKTSLLLSEKRLRIALRELNASAGGNFCGVSLERQQSILKHFEQCDPALFQTLWTLANHSYYSQLATLRYSASMS